MSTANNPIYDRLTRGSKWPSARGAIWIGIGVGMAAMTLSLGVLLAVVFDERFPGIYGLIDLFPAAGVTALGLFCIPASFAAAARLTAKYALDQDFALVRISPLYAEDIVEGCSRAARYRLRLLWALAFWMLPSTWAGVLV